ncbi:hypothetical protein B0H16DRAFT_1503368 [Mycena metata]|uniref:SH3 domain-containing protein n=1 Tax=Mycena metata TaxID=1033252 RepID=A0AAD7K6Y2_9AGAR|nr:hypothetical protein B0H16DRAFT_1503368 [Mycena metata]
MKQQLENSSTDANGNGQQGQRQLHGFAIVLGNYFYLGTILLAFAAWLVAFVAQIAVTKTVGRSAVGVLWFAIFLQLFLIGGVLLILSRSDARAFQLQICAFGVMAAVFAVIGVDMSIFAAEPARSALAAGWLVLAIVDILWVLYFSAEPETPVARLVQRMAVAPRKSTSPDIGRDAERHISGPRARVGSMAHAQERKLSQSDAEEPGSPGDETKVGHQQRRGDSRASAGGSNTSNTSLEISGDWTGMGRQRIVDPLTQQRESSAGESEPEPLEEEGMTQTQSQTHSFPPPTSKNRRAVYLQEPRHLSTIYDNTAEGGSTENGDNSERMRTPRDSASESERYPFRVRARSDWIPRSPSEISFRKGDILYSSEKAGKKWWTVKKADGVVGSAPSNYFKVLGG